MIDVIVRIPSYATLTEYLAIRGTRIFGTLANNHFDG
jgi:hypothetical protein